LNQALCCVGIRLPYHVSQTALTTTLRASVGPDSNRPRRGLSQLNRKMRSEGVASEGRRPPFHQSPERFCAPDPEASRSRWRVSIWIRSRRSHKPVPIIDRNRYAYNEHCWSRHSGRLHWYADRLVVDAFVRSFSYGRLRAETEHRQNQRRFLSSRELTFSYPYQCNYTAKHRQARPEQHSIASTLNRQSLAMRNPGNLPSLSIR